MLVCTRLAIVAYAAFFAMGCAAVTTALFDVREKIEVLIGEQGAGLYTITAEKDGKTIFSRQVRCEQGADGKLVGCHPLTKE